MRPRSLLSALLLAASPAAWAAEDVDSWKCPDCNIVLVEIDTLRPDHLGCYGYRRGTSPRIDALAAEGTVFDNFIVQAYLTPVSMASIFTSQYPSVNGFTSFSAAIDSSTAVLPEILRGHGFKTAAFLTSPEFYSLYTPPWGERVDTISSFRRGFDVYDFPKESPYFQPGTGSPPSRESAREFRDVPGDEVFRWIENNRGSKFFLWLPIGAAHWPYGRTAPTETKERFFPHPPRGPIQKEGAKWWYPLGMIYKNRLHPLPDAPEWPRPGLFDEGPLSVTPRDRSFLLGRYDAGVHHADSFVGRVWDALRKYSLDQKTIVIVTAEHAEDLGEHGYYSHYDIYNTELRAPLIVRHPRRQKAATRVDALVSGLDLGPGILELAGLPAMPHAQGVSFLRKLSAPDDDKSLVFSERMPYWERVLYEMMLFNAPKELASWRKTYLKRLEPYFGAGWDETTADTSVQDRRWHLIHRRAKELLRRISWWAYLTRQPIDPAEFELYDKRVDPLETRSVLEENPGPAAELKQRLAAFERDMDARRKNKTPTHKPRRLIPYP
ncbi:MAG: sulfatase [Elusimicrobia bacterium]|nr:sulfatase [Elusimicrobiota bacterium]